MFFLLFHIVKLVFFLQSEHSNSLCVFIFSLTWYLSNYRKAEDGHCLFGGWARMAQPIHSFNVVEVLMFAFSSYKGVLFKRLVFVLQRSLTECYGWLKKNDIFLDQAWWKYCSDFKNCLRN